MLGRPSLDKNFWASKKSLGIFFSGEGERRVKGNISHVLLENINKQANRQIISYIVKYKLFYKWNVVAWNPFGNDGNF